MLKEQPPKGKAKLENIFFPKNECRSKKIPYIFNDPLLKKNMKRLNTVYFPDLLDLLSQRLFGYQSH